MLQSPFSRLLAAALAATVLAYPVQAEFIELVTIGNPGNPGEQSRLQDFGDTTYYGGVNFRAMIWWSPILETTRIFIRTA